MPKSFTHLSLAVLIVILPFLFWTLTPNFFATPKHILVLLTSTLLISGYFINVLKHKSLVLPTGKLVLPLIFFLFAIVLNLTLNSEGRPEALAGKGALLLALPLVSLYLSTLKNRVSLANIVKNSVIITSSLLAFHTILQLTFLATLPALPTFMQSRSFTPTGSVLTTLIFIILGSITALSSITTSAPKFRPYYVIATLLTSISAIASIAVLLPGGILSLDLIPYKECWSITLDALKSTRSMFVGVGLANFSLLYTSVKPLSLNLTPLWNALPQTGTSELLTLLSTGGFTLFLSILWLMVTGYKSRGSKSLESPLFVLFLGVILNLILLPGSVLTYLLFFLILPLLDGSESKTIVLSKNSHLVIGLLGLGITLLAFATSQKPSVAEFYMRKAQLALIQSDGKNVYENQLRAIAWYPKMTNYHLSSADLNMNLASALSQKTDLTEADRTTISQLISQSIREAKTAVSLRGNYSATWQTLGKIYRNLINVATGSEQFAIDYYSQAVALDPANPALRIEYGGLFYQLAVATKDPTTKALYFNRAKVEFKTAIESKPNYANGYYNLSKVFETEGDLNSSYLAMQKVVANLDPNSIDYASALAELETLKSKLPKNTTPVTDNNTTGELSTPSPLPSPLPGGPVDLPNGLESQ